jgi:hypothetical protein
VNISILLEKPTSAVHLVFVPGVEDEAVYEFVIGRWDHGWYVICQAIQGGRQIQMFSHSS